MGVVEQGDQTITNGEIHVVIDAGKLLLQQMITADYLVVIAIDQVLASGQLTHDVTGSLGVAEEDVAQHVDIICIRNVTLPVCNQYTVHLVGRSTMTSVGTETENVPVPKVTVAGEPNL